MQKAGNPLTGRRNLFIILTVITVIIADQLTKAWICTFPFPFVISRLGFLRIVHILNTGSAFGLFQGQSAMLKVVGIVGVVVLLLLAFWIYRKYSYLVTKWNGVAYGLVLGGSIGNLIDRLRFGYVTDFIDAGFWPAFNIADSGITIGEIMIAISLLRLALAERR
jgi:signal peptidase II